MNLMNFIALHSEISLIASNEFLKWSCCAVESVDTLEATDVAGKAQSFRLYSQLPCSEVEKGIV
jgi:hypothetical protein